VNRSPLHPITTNSSGPMVIFLSAFQDVFNIFASSKKAGQRIPMCIAVVLLSDRSL
jgi:hypothetical protein